MQTDGLLPSEALEVCRAGQGCTWSSLWGEPACGVDLHELPVCPRSRRQRASGHVCL